MFQMVNEEPRRPQEPKRMAAVLIFVGAKMLVGRIFEIPTILSLGVVCGVPVVTLFASLRTAKHHPGCITRVPTGN